MEFTKTAVDGCWIIDLKPFEDARGGFARTFCVDEFAEHGIPTEVKQANMSWNHKKGTMRGMRWPSPERWRRRSAATVQEMGSARSASAKLRQNSRRFSSASGE